MTAWDGRQKTDLGVAVPSTPAASGRRQLGVVGGSRRCARDVPNVQASRRYRKVTSWPPEIKGDIGKIFFFFTRFQIELIISSPFKKKKRRR